MLESLLNTNGNVNVNVNLIVIFCFLVAVCDGWMSSYICDRYFGATCFYVFFVGRNQSCRAFMQCVTDA